VSPTSGTLFAGSKLPLRTWFLAIHLLTQHKNGLSALSLRRQLGVSYNTAWLMKYKLQLDPSFYTCLRILSVSVLEKTQLSCALRTDASQTGPVCFSNKLILFDF
jgi:hypothetical protein